MQKTPTTRSGPRGECVGSAGDLAGLEAAGAHVQTLRGAVDGGPDALDVGVEAALRDLARPRAVVAEAGLLGADVADGSHRVLLKRIDDVGTGRKSWGQPGGQPQKIIRCARPA